MKHLSLLLLLSLFFQPLFGQRLKVSKNQRFLITEKGEPFFYMADTAWELFHRCTREQSEQYLSKRAEQGFSVVQAVALAEIDGLLTPNPYGEVPLIEENPKKPNARYFEHIDYIIKKADSLNLYIGLLPTWGDKVFKNSWGKGPEIFTPENAFAYGKWIGDRYKNFDNIIWIIGGDRNPRPDSNDVAIWNQIAEGIAKGAGGYDQTLMSYHPQPKRGGGSSTWFHNEPWLDFNMHQTGHCPDHQSHARISHDYNLIPVKPTLDGEPLYEDHPYCFNAKEFGYSIPENIRPIMYSNVFAGACGQTYGNHNVWQMYSSDKVGINGPLRPWPMALDLPAANQVRHLKNLMLSRPYLSRIPDQTLVASAQELNEHYVSATRDAHGTYALFYFPTGKPVQANLSKLRGKSLVTHWYDPRTGATFLGPKIGSSREITISPPTEGKGQDWVWIVDDSAQAYAPPGSQ
ncbi:glycoside hydrolase family 140 protein [Pareuzebyella sediminis]|uniref:glycoside hydrolase family 140 protein n=1 Tax=Pareuzebyella sediminis TaxID=2607998 RepID=UPI0011EF1B28|nr:glycoside hydrolase family 140 protein [Pareuzebyella sediminis]